MCCLSVAMHAPCTWPKEDSVQVLQHLTLEEDMYDMK